MNGGVEHFVKIPVWLLERADLRAGAKLLYARIVDRIRLTGACRIGQRGLAQDVGISLKAANRGVAELRAAGLIEAKPTSTRGPRLGRTYVYRLTEAADPERTRINNVTEWVTLSKRAHERSRFDLPNVVDSTTRRDKKKRSHQSAAAGVMRALKNVGVADPGTQARLAGTPGVTVAGVEEWAAVGRARAAAGRCNSPAGFVARMLERGANPDPDELAAAREAARAERTATERCARHKRDLAAAGEQEKRDLAVLAELNESDRAKVCAALPAALSVRVGGVRYRGVPRWGDVLADSALRAAAAALAAPAAQQAAQG